MCVSFSYMCLNKLIDFLWWAFHIPPYLIRSPWKDSLDPKVHAVKWFFMCLGQPQRQGNRGILQGSSPEPDLISDTVKASTSIGSLALHEMVDSYVVKLADDTARNIYQYHTSPFCSHAIKSSVFRKKRGTVNTLSVLVFLASLCGEKLSTKYSCERIYCFITSLIKKLRLRQHEFGKYHGWLFQTNLVSHNWHRYRIHWFGLVLVVVLQRMSQDTIMCMAWNADGLWCGVDEKNAPVAPAQISLHNKSEACFWSMIHLSHVRDVMKLLSSKNC